MNFYYSTGRNIQMLIALLKAHGIKKVIASPGTTNLEFVASLQHDGEFEMYSCVDERSAAYMACGLADESGEPVVITCTEATASRNYFSGLTEAYHRKLPVLAITGLHDYALIGHLEPQVIDRSISPNDLVRLKVNLPVIKDENDVWESELKINQAILELTRHGGGPVHINLPWPGTKFDLSAQQLPAVRVIKRYYKGNELPKIPSGRIAIYVGSHSYWRKEQIEAIDSFCAANNAVVLCDHTSRYKEKYRILPALLSIQHNQFDVLSDIDLLVHIGEESGDANTMCKLRKVKEVWRVSPDGELRDTFKKLSNVFEMEEKDFFEYYSASKSTSNDKYLQECKECYRKVVAMIPELPFSSIYVASKIAPRLPEYSVIHLGVSDTIRAWTMFDIPQSVKSSCNAGCRGIDGCVSALVGASFANKDKIYFGVVGDLTFFYDMNVLGNHCLGSNVRILLVNNGGGNIFKHNGAPANRLLGNECADEYIAAGGHFGNKSPVLVKHYAEDLGFEYMSASSKEEFEEVYGRFITPEITQKPMLFEVFTETLNDSEAFSIMGNLVKDLDGKVKTAVKQLLGEQTTAFVKKMIKK